MGIATRLPRAWGEKSSATVEKIALMRRQEGVLDEGVGSGLGGNGQSQFDELT